jgi:hypothetical protein
LGATEAIPGRQRCLRDGRVRYFATSTMNVSVLLSAFFSLFPLVGSLILLFRDRSWPVIFLLLGSILSFCVTLLIVAYAIVGGSGTPGYIFIVRFGSLPGRILFCVGFLAYALKRECSLAVVQVMSEGGDRDSILATARSLMALRERCCSSRLVGHAWTRYSYIHAFWFHEIPRARERLSCR